MSYFLVLPAAGRGLRFGAELPKQYAPLAGRTVIEWALEPFLADERCERIVLALAREDANWERLASRWPAPQRTRVQCVPGGEHRSESVRAGLARLTQQGASPQEQVLVHDAVRPCVTAGEIDRLLGAAAACEHGGLLALPLADTLKRAGEGGRTVAQTVGRESLWRALTPQMFRLGVLAAALDAAHAAGRFPTDEAEAVEWNGGAPLLVEGEPTNLKITRGTDLALAAAILQGAGS